MRSSGSRCSARGETDLTTSHCKAKCASAVSSGFGPCDQPAGSMTCFPPFDGDFRQTPFPCSTSSLPGCHCSNPALGRRELAFAVWTLSANVTAVTNAHTIEATGKFFLTLVILSMPLRAMTTVPLISRTMVSMDSRRFTSNGIRVKKCTSGNNLD